MDKKKLEDLVDLKKQINFLTEEFDKLKEELLPDLGNEAIGVWDFLVHKSSRTTWKLKKGVNEKGLIAKYPEYTKFDLTSFVKKNEVLGKVFAEPNTSTSLTIKQRK